MGAATATDCCKDSVWIRNSSVCRNDTAATAVWSALLPPWSWFAVRSRRVSSNSQWGEIARTEINRAAEWAPEDIDSSAGPLSVTRLPWQGTAELESYPEIRGEAWIPPNWKHPWMMLSTLSLSSNTLSPACCNPSSPKQFICPLFSLPVTERN